MASGEPNKVESFRLELTIHSLTIDSTAKKYFVKAYLEKGNEVETGKMKKSEQGGVVFFETPLELNFRPNSDEKPNLKFSVVEFRDDHSFVNGKATIPFHEYYESHPHQKELKLRKCADSEAKLYLSVKFKQYKVATSSFIAKLEGGHSSSSSSSSGSDDESDEKVKKVEKSDSDDGSEKKEEKVEKIVQKTEEKLEEILEKKDEKIEKVLEKTDKEIEKELRDAQEKEQKVREKMEKEIEKIIEKGEDVQEKIEKVIEKAEEKIEKIEEKMEEKIEKVEEKKEEKVEKIEKKAEKKAEEVEEKAEKKVEKVSRKSSSSSSEEEVKVAVPPTHQTSTIPNSRGGSVVAAKGENKCSCAII